MGGLEVHLNTASEVKGVVNIRVDYIGFQNMLTLRSKPSAG